MGRTDSHFDLSIGSKDYLILRNHGLLTTGRSVAEAFTRMFYLNRACEIQLATLSAGQSSSFRRPKSANTRPGSTTTTLTSTRYTSTANGRRCCAVERDGAAYRC